MGAARRRCARPGAAWSAPEVMPVSTSTSAPVDRIGDVRPQLQWHRVPPARNAGLFWRRRGRAQASRRRARKRRVAMSVMSPRLLQEAAKQGIISTGSSNSASRAILRTAAVRWRWPSAMPGLESRRVCWSELIYPIPPPAQRQDLRLELWRTRSNWPHRGWAPWPSRGSPDRTCYLTPLAQRQC